MGASNLASPQPSGRERFVLTQFFHWLSLLWQNDLFDDDQRYGRSRQLRGANSFILEYFSRRSLFLKDVEGSLAVTH
jgi:hypothetical protein